MAFVINYDLPTNIESYIHRIGRTGRIGKAGTAVSFIDVNDESMYYKLYNVLNDSKQEIPRWFEMLLRRKYVVKDYNRADQRFYNTSDESNNQGEDEKLIDLRRANGEQARSFWNFQRGYSDGVYKRDTRDYEVDNIITYDS